jgi:hypothetical protein
MVLIPLSVESSIRPPVLQLNVSYNLTIISKLSLGSLPNTKTSYIPRTKSHIHIQ